MIDKLKSKIFILMMTSLSIIVLGIIVIFTVLNCTNTVRQSRMSIERITRIKDRPGFQMEQITPEIQSFINAENEKANSHIKIAIIFAIVASGLALIGIYVISKKTSELIVQPVYSTLEKQKQFISDASHELKTPLAVIEANADVLENELRKQ